MPAPGYVFRDGGPIPDSDLPPHQVGSPASQDTRQFSTPNSSTLNTPSSTNSTLNASTDSHALAEADHDIKGAAQQVHSESEVKDLGWNEHPEHVPAPLVGGLPNEELWMLVRRFDKQTYHVKATPVIPPGGLDLETAQEDEFSPDKLRANVERLYMTVIIGIIGFAKHLARLRSWREPRRTAAFMAAYFFAWVFNFIMLLMFTTLIVLIVYPPSRTFLFPPAPLALVDSKTGGIQSPRAGVLGSHDSLTGAPERHRGEAVEQEATNFVSGLASIALSSATGKHEQGDSESDSINKAVPDPTSLALSGSDAKDSASGSSRPKHDKTKQPMEDTMWIKMRPAMHVIGEISDGWERFANALSPTPPFPEDKPRMKLAALLVPAVLISLLTTSAMFMKQTTFFIGFGFFGDPVIWRAASYLNRKFPNWQKLLELRNTILRGVPTNAQLTLTLLRIGEANKAPLPPPPRSDQPPPDRPKSLNGDDLTLDASNEEIHEAIHANPSDSTAADTLDQKKPKHHHGARILGFLKGTAKTGVETKLGVDKVRATVGSEDAKDHLGILPKADEQFISGPVDFVARYKGKKGHVILSTSASVTCVSFRKHSSEGSGALADMGKEKPLWSVPVGEIQELKKLGGLGWKAKLVVGWATDRQVADGLEIVTKGGEVFKITAIPLRDELFNRLIAMGPQKWESW